MNSFLTLIFLAFCSLTTTSAANLKGSWKSDPLEIDAEIETEIDSPPERELKYCDMAGVMEGLVPSFTCNCAGSGGDDSRKLMSKCDDSCNHCDSSGTYCAETQVWASMNLNSVTTTLSYTYTYVQGRSDRISIMKYGCQGDPNSLDNLSCGRCVVKVNYVSCNSCNLMSGSDNTGYPWGGGVSFDCSNIVSGGVYDLSANPTIPASSVFAVLSQKKDSNYQQCVASA